MPSFPLWKHRILASKTSQTEEYKSLISSAQGQGQEQHQITQATANTKGSRKGDIGLFYCPCVGTKVYVLLLAEVVGGTYGYEVWPQTALGKAEPILKFKISAHVKVGERLVVDSDSPGDQVVG